MFWQLHRQPTRWHCCLLPVSQKAVYQCTKKLWHTTCFVLNSSNSRYNRWNFWHIQVFWELCFSGTWSSHKNLCCGIKVLYTLITFPIRIYCIPVVNTLIWVFVNTLVWVFTDTLIWLISRGFILPFNWGGIKVFIYFSSPLIKQWVYPL